MKKHTDHPSISDKLENIPCIWTQEVIGIGMLSAYPTQNGLAIFLNFAKGGGLC